MKQSVYVKLVLILAGVIGISVGMGQLFFPVAFEASAGISVAGETNLLSEIRAAGGTLLLAGIVMLFGVFKPSSTDFALSLAMLFYLAYGLSRSYGMVIDGIPSQSMVMVTIVEIVIGLAAYVSYVMRRKGRLFLFGKSKDSPSDSTQ